MIVKRDKHIKEQLICDFTEVLTKNLAYQSEFYRVYVLDRVWAGIDSDSDKIQYPIRVTGRTIGVLNLTQDMIIDEIIIDKEFIKDNFSNYGELIAPYIGEKFDISNL